LIFSTGSRKNALSVFSFFAAVYRDIIWFYYYQGQLDITPLTLWFSYLTARFHLHVCHHTLLYSFGLRSNTFDAFAFIGLNKVAIWTIFVLFWNYDYYFSPETRDFRFVILLLHIGMMLIAFTLLKEMTKLSIKGYLFDPWLFFCSLIFLII